jgi:hypothetical protein
VAARLAAQDAAAAAWNVRDLGERPPEEVAQALVACGLQGVPTPARARDHVAAHLGAWALDHATPLPGGEERAGALPAPPRR